MASNVAKEDVFGKVTVNATKFIVNYVARFGMAGIVVCCCWIPFQKIDGWFAWHIILCTFGYIPLMAEAIMLFVGDELWSRQVTRRTKYYVHGILIAVSTGVIIVGNALVFRFLDPGYHLYTAHGITGLVSMILLIISLALGLAINYREELKKLCTWPSSWYKLLHNVVGLLGYAIGIVSLCFAYYTNWFKYYFAEESRLAVLIVTIIVSLWTINGAVRSAYGQIKSVFE